MPLQLLGLPTTSIDIDKGSLGLQYSSFVARSCFEATTAPRKMSTLFLLKLLFLGCLVSAFNFTNGPGQRIKHGGHTLKYEPIIELSEVLIASELGENSTALNPYANAGFNQTSSNNLTATSQSKNIFKRQDNRPEGALKCSATEECVDGSCCGAVSLPTRVSFLRQWDFEISVV